MKIEMKQVGHAAQDRLKSMTDRANSSQAFFSRVLYPFYQSKQVQRWQTENESEPSGYRGAGRWQPIDPTYRLRKLKKFASAEYSGEKTLVGSGRLIKSVVGGSADHRAIFSRTSMTITTMVPYAKYAAQARPFMRFSPQTIQEMKTKIRAFIKDGKT